MTDFYNRLYDLRFPKDMPPDETSLDRYLENRAGLLLGHASVRRGLVIMAFVGTMMMLMALAVVIGSLVSGQPQVMAGAIGPGIAGFVNLTLSRFLRGRSKPALDVNANLSPEARMFMAELMQGVFGWPRAWGANEPGIWSAQGPHARRRERRVWRRMFASGSWGDVKRSSKDLLLPGTFEVLDRAAYQYNRISGILGSDHPELARFAPTVRAAADQSMADLFHVAHLLEDYPESAATNRDKAEEEVGALTELAEKLEQMEKTPVTIPALEKPSPIHSVLEELRLDQLARSELGERPQEDAQQKITGQS